MPLAKKPLAWKDATEFMKLYYAAYGLRGKAEASHVVLNTFRAFNGRSEEECDELADLVSELELYAEGVLSQLDSARQNARERRRHLRKAKCYLMKGTRLHEKVKTWAAGGEEHYPRLARPPEGARAPRASRAPRAEARASRASASPHRTRSAARSARPAR